MSPGKELEQLKAAHIELSRKSTELYAVYANAHQDFMRVVKERDERDEIISMRDKIIGEHEKEIRKLNVLVEDLLEANEDD